MSRAPRKTETLSLFGSAEASPPPPAAATEAKAATAAVSDVPTVVTAVVPAVEPAAIFAPPPAPLPAVELPLPMREVLGFPLRLVSLLPLPTTLVCEVVTSTRVKLLGQLVVLTTSQPAYAAARAKRLPIFLGREMPLLALAVEHDRLEPRRFAEWLEAKAKDAQFRIDGAMAIGELGAGEVERIAPKGWWVGRVLAELGLRLLEVTTGAEVPASLQEHGQGRDERGAA